MDSTQGSTSPTASASAAAAAADFKRMPMAEKILAVAAVLGVVGFFVHPYSGFDLFFKVWMPTCLFIGSVLVLALIGTKLFKITLVSGPIYTKLLVFAAVLPAIGLVLDSFSHMGMFVTLVAIVAMAYAGAKITTRENIFK